MGAGIPDRSESLAPVIVLLVALGMQRDQIPQVSAYLLRSIHHLPAEVHDLVQD